MQRGRKRKQNLCNNGDTQPSRKAIRPIKNPNPITAVFEPYPLHPRPTPEECSAIRDELLEVQGFPEEFAKHRKERENLEACSSSSLNGSTKSEGLMAEGCGSAQKLSVLDGLVSTILSQNTTDVNSQRAFASLKSAFPTWEEYQAKGRIGLGKERKRRLVLTAEQKLIENAIRCGGLAPTKAFCIKNTLSCLKEKNGKLCLEYLRDLSIDKIKSELSCFKGIGPKTVACVLMFHLQQDDFPVDTHILQIAKTLGWVPEGADAKKAYLHLNCRIPNELKFDLNCLLFTHGKMCNGCSTKLGKHEKKDSIKKPCPLLNFCNNSG
ncbi:hypothetical protein Cgig2_006202 [Carnegiea gigantea]|uniref:HhH-GPD domain-containing protein n=1 Tax=Carnegiea gigantea TaxID=171969 RepID=A0A9Q1QS16_9CARY|nr:hypothetical protein Cgig2_006202 [Carnegiea gigantea]